MRRRRTGTAPGRFERFLLSFMGPPQLGDLSAPVPEPSDPAADLCPRCDRPWAGHTTVRTASRTYLTCPPAQDGG